MIGVNIFKDIEKKHYQILTFFEMYLAIFDIALDEEDYASLEKSLKTVSESKEKKLSVFIDAFSGKEEIKEKLKLLVNDEEYCYFDSESRKRKFNLSEIGEDLLGLIMYYKDYLD